MLSLLLFEIPFFSIVATQLHYVVALTSTNPQDFAMYMLNARPDQAIVTCLIYTNPQRLDVYHNGVYVVPKSAEMMDNGNLRYLSSEDPSDFVPLITDEPGSNNINNNNRELIFINRYFYFSHFYLFKTYLYYKYNYYVIIK